jgi:hypothetical protein
VPPFRRAPRTSSNPQCICTALYARRWSCTSNRTCSIPPRRMGKSLSLNLSRPSSPSRCNRSPRRSRPRAASGTAETSPAAGRPRVRFSWMASSSSIAAYPSCSATRCAGATSIRRPRLPTQPRTTNSRTGSTPTTPDRTVHRNMTNGQVGCAPMMMVSVRSIGLAKMLKRRGGGRSAWWAEPGSSRPCGPPGAPPRRVSALSGDDPSPDAVRPRSGRQRHRSRPSALPSPLGSRAPDGARLPALARSGRRTTPNQYIFL